MHGATCDRWWHWSRMELIRMYKSSTKIDIQKVESTDGRWVWKINTQLPSHLHRRQQCTPGDRDSPRWPAQLPHSLLGNDHCRVPQFLLNNSRVICIPLSLHHKKDNLSKCTCLSLQCAEVAYTLGKATHWRRTLTLVIDSWWLPSFLPSE